MNEKLCLFTLQRNVLVLNILGTTLWLLSILLACVRAICHNDNMFSREIFGEVLVPLVVFHVPGFRMAFLLTTNAIYTSF